MILAAAVLSLMISAPVCMSPCTVKVTVKIDDATERDHCELIIDGEEYHASTLEVHTGQRTYETTFNVRLAGEYEVTVTLDRPVDHHYSQKRALVVNGMSEDGAEGDVRATR